MISTNPSVSQPLEVGSVKTPVPSPCLLCKLRECTDPESTLKAPLLFSVSF